MTISRDGAAHSALTHGHFLSHPSRLVLSFLGCDATYYTRVWRVAHLDACEQDPWWSKVACETASKSGVTKVIRNAIKDIGYDDSSKGFDYKTCTSSSRSSSSPPISPRASRTTVRDQGITFGYEAPEYMPPLAIMLAHKLNAALVAARRSGLLPWLRPDSKTGHGRGSSMLRRSRRRTSGKEILKKEIKQIQPLGRFVIGGPLGDGGLTGRKIVVDTYGGWGAHGGGAFSGKGFSKVDRSAAYTARWIAKSLVAGGLARRALVQLSYAIDVAEPLSIFVDTYGTGKKSDLELVEIIRKNWDLRPGVIVKQLDLQKPIYHKTAAYGHFGNLDYSWEKPKQLVL
ncbi:methionine adenosyltransferase [Lactarius sanguifluus]|nr:methionine adenosyltransferase [Lactarius sanguifluus]